MNLSKRIFGTLTLFFLAVAFMGAVEAYNTQVSYTQDYTTSPLLIGSEPITISSPEYTCGVGAGEKIVYSKPRADCWQIRAEYDGRFIILRPGEETKLADHIYLSCTPSAKMFWNSDYQRYVYDKSTHWQNHCSLTVRNFELKPKVDLPVNQVLIDEDLQLLLSVENDLGDFPAHMAGAFVRKKNDMLFRDEPWEEINFEVNSPSSAVTLNADTSEIGSITLEIQPFIRIKGDKTVILPSEEIIEAEYLVTPDQGSFQKPSALQKLLSVILGWFK